MKWPSLVIVLLAPGDAAAFDYVFDTEIVVIPEPPILEKGVPWTETRCSGPK